MEPDPSDIDAHDTQILLSEKVCYIVEDVVANIYLSHSLPSFAMLISGVTVTAI